MSAKSADRILITITSRKYLFAFIESNAGGHFYKLTKLEIMILMLTLYSLIVAIFFYCLDLKGVSKCESKCQLVKGFNFQGYRFHQSLKFGLGQPNEVAFLCRREIKQMN